MEITKREILVGIAIFITIMSLGIIIRSSIENNINSKNEKYYKALKVKEDENMFKYAVQTNVGYILAQGNVTTIDPVKKDIEGEYLYIEKIMQRYTMHTREVAHTTKVGNTTQTYYTTETYWTWDFVNKEEFHADKFTYLGVEFNYGDIKFSNSYYKDTIYDGGYTRYEYYVIPSNFQGCLFSKIENNQFKEIDFKCDTNIEQIIESKQKEPRISGIIFIFVWTILSVGIVFGYLYLDNNYLED
jgi:hypothetical protein